MASFRDQLQAIRMEELKKINNTFFEQVNSVLSSVVVPIDSLKEDIIMHAKDPTKGSAMAMLYVNMSSIMNKGYALINVTPCLSTMRLEKLELKTPLKAMDVYRLKVTYNQLIPEYNRIQTQLKEAFPDAFIDIDVIDSGDIQFKVFYKMDPIMPPDIPCIKY